LIWTGFDVLTAPQRFQRTLHADLTAVSRAQRQQLLDEGDQWARATVQAHQEAVDKLLQTALGEEDDE